MLLNNFFSITEINHNEGAVKASLSIHKEHPVFNGHFPGQPIVPGVCMLQMLKEVLKTQVNADIKLVSADFLKFLKFINPQETNTVNLDLQYVVIDVNTLKVNGGLVDADAVYFKFKGIYEMK